MPFNFLNLFRLVFSILYFQSYAVMQTSTRFPFLAVQRNISFNPMQLCELRLTTQTTSVFQSYVAAWTTLCQKVSKASDVHSFNLMQSHGLLLHSFCFVHFSSRFQSYAVTRAATDLKRVISTAHHISILCSHTGCDSNNTQRLHFVYNIALCVLLFLML